MSVTGSITTKFIDEKGVDLGRQLVEKDYLISVYPNLVPQLKSAGLFTWGRNFNGQLGDGTVTNRSSPVQTITYSTNWKFASCGYNFTAATKTDGTLWGWGNNQYGQLGDNSAVHRLSPVQNITFASNWLQVSCGSNHTAAIKTDGTLWTWGINNIGQLGDNTLINRSSPVQTIAGSINWKKVSTGNFHIAAIKTDGILWTWGQNAFGNLGDLTVSNKSSPIQVISGANTWKQVSAGGRHTAAIRDFNY